MSIDLRKKPVQEITPVRRHSRFMTRVIYSPLYINK